jgi:hypothetical protein
MNNVARNRFVFVFPAVCLAAALFACHHPNVVIDVRMNGFYPECIHKLDVNSAGYGVTVLEGLSLNDDIFLAKIKNNRVRWNRSVASTVSGAEQGQEELRSLAEVVTTETGETFLRYEKHWQVTPPDQNAQLQALTHNRMRSIGGNMDVENSTTKQFYVDVSPTTTAFELKPATLRKIGTYCKVWVVDEYFGNGKSDVNQAQVTAIAAKFDEIYPLETNLLGYEYGGGPGGNGGMDGDPKIQILLFDIDGDENFVGSSGGLTYGYFYPGDEFARGNEYPYSNEAEIFYLDSGVVGGGSDIYSTLIHEFNHMINFNLKVIAGGDYLSWNTEVWYTEMLSLLAEDIIGPLVGITSTDHVIYKRIAFQWFLSYADYSVMYWPSSGNTLPYYSSNYAFGAYLMRNFGGPALFSAIAKSNLSGRGSIDNQMRLFNHDMGIDTAYALSRFGEAILYSGDNAPERVLTFDKEVTDVIGDRAYTFQAFDIWSLFPAGPMIREYANMPNYAAPANTVQLYADPAWAEEIAATGGRLTMRLLNVEADADYYIMTKTKQF